jgi:hypothetical protein
MARMIAEVYQALRSAGAPEDEARAAATAVDESDREIADMKADIKVLKYMVGINTGLLLIVLGKLFLPGAAG